MRPIHNKVLIQEPELGEQKQGGIILPSTMTKLQVTEGLVIAAGPTCEHVKKDDRVLFDRYAMESHRIKLDGRQHFLIVEDELLAILK